MPIFSTVTTKKISQFKPPRRSSDPFIFDISEKKTDEVIRGANVNELKDHYRYKDGFIFEPVILPLLVQPELPSRHSGIILLYKTVKSGEDQTNVNPH